MHFVNCQPNKKKWLNDYDDIKCRNGRQNGERTHLGKTETTKMHSDVHPGYLFKVKIIFQDIFGNKS